MSETILAFIILIAAYLFLIPMLIVMINPVVYGFKKDFRIEFIAYHWFMFYFALVGCALFGIYWAINVVMRLV